MTILVRPNDGFLTLAGRVVWSNPSLPDATIAPIVLRIAIRRREVSLIKRGPGVRVYVEDEDGTWCPLAVYLARIRRFIDEWCMPRRR